jgi:type II secretory pathway component PulL
MNLWQEQPRPPADWMSSLVPPHRLQAEECRGPTKKALVPLAREVFQYQEKTPLSETSVSPLMVSQVGRK